MFDFSIVTTWFDSLLRNTLGLGDFLSILIECVIVGVLILTVYALLAIALIFMERKVCAYFQCRLGPMRVGPWGIFQVFADVVKMLIKEIFFVDKADKLLYIVAPFLVIIGSVGAFSFMTWNKGAGILDYPLYFTASRELFNEASSLQAMLLASLAIRLIRPVKTLPGPISIITSTLEEVID